MLTDTSKSNSTLGTQLHAIIRTHVQLRYSDTCINVENLTSKVCRAVVVVVVVVVVVRQKTV